MNELIKIDSRELAGATVQTVNARDLHVFLENGDHFTTWIKERISQYGFLENQDFVTFSASAEKGRPRIEYALSIDMGKELSMVERNEKGKQARQYFLECEKRARAVPALPRTFAEALRLAESKWCRTKRKLPCKRKTTCHYPRH